MAGTMQSSPMTEVELNDLLMGAAIYGCGGGGTLDEARYYLNLTMKLGAPKLVCPSSIPSSSLIAMPYRIGSPLPPREEETPAVHTALRYTERLGVHPNAMVSFELGAVNPMIAIYCAAVLGVPLLDADQVGCAVPEIPISLLSMHGILPDRVVAASSLGDLLVLDHPHSDQMIDAVLRVTAENCQNGLGVVGRVQKLDKMKVGLNFGSMKMAMEIGAAWRKAGEAGADIARAVTDTAEGCELFRGTLIAAKNTENGGFLVSEIDIRGEDGRGMRIITKNENMAAFIDGEVVATIPEVISVLEEGNGIPLLNPINETGQKVVVIVLPAAESFKTELGMSVYGPKYAGLEEPFRSAI